MAQGSNGEEGGRKEDSTKADGKEDPEVGEDPEKLCLWKQRGKQVGQYSE